jgi:6-pyruvoyltetrahydropterin/6-carboxytetrahydropterin synthase
MYRIRKEFHFSASHVLEGLPVGHPCGRLHGHNYVVTVELASEELDFVGFVVDYGELKEFKRYIDQEIDHRNLNTVLPGQPSAENLARHFYNFCRDRWPETVAVSVSETPKTWAEYRP